MHEELGRVRLQLREELLLVASVALQMTLLVNAWRIYKELRMTGTPTPYWLLGRCVLLCS